MRPRTSWSPSVSRSTPSIRMEPCSESQGSAEKSTRHSRQANGLECKLSLLTGLSSGNGSTYVNIGREQRACSTRGRAQQTAYLIGLHDAEQRNDERRLAAAGAAADAHLLPRRNVEGDTLATGTRSVNTIAGSVGHVSIGDLLACRGVVNHLQW